MSKAAPTVAPAVAGRRPLRFAGVDFDDMAQEEAVGWLLRRRPDQPFAYVVTPNADHVVRLHERSDWRELQDAYRQAALRLCDSRVLALLARLRGLRLRPVPGSDLVERILQHRPPLDYPPLDHPPLGRLLLIGGAEGAAERLREHLPGTEVLQHRPPMDLLSDEDALAACAAFVAANPHDLALIAVGSPQQELIALRAARTPGAQGTALCIGAAVDFLTGKARRAPRWMQVLALEWLHRLASDPRRMWRRYLLRGPRALWLAFSRP